MARRTIEIDEDVVAVLLANISTFGETENDVLRRLLLPAADSTPVADDRLPRQRRYVDERCEDTITPLLEAGTVQAGDFLVYDRSGRKLRAVVLEDGSLRLANDETAYASPAAALQAVLGRHEADAWSAWRQVATQRTLSELRALQLT
ncbi:MAG: hypothetical protein ACT4QF_05215 [Sporichthyaceae bacterium]